MHSRTDFDFRPDPVDGFHLALAGHARKREGSRSSLARSAPSERETFNQCERETMSAEKGPCSICGLDWSQAHWAFGRLWCEKCWAGRKPATAMPPTEAGKRQIAAWLRPRTSTPPRQQTLAGGELVQRQGANRG